MPFKLSVTTALVTILYFYAGELMSKNVERKKSKITWNVMNDKLEGMAGQSMPIG